MVMLVPVMPVKLILVIEPFSFTKLTFRMVLLYVLVLFEEFIHLLLER
jgi:hypothetical protein